MQSDRRDQSTEEPAATELEGEVQPAHRGNHAVQATAGALGVVSGAGLGALAAGPPGAVAGAIIGAAIGAASGWAADADVAEHALSDDELDKDIGVSEGTLGAENLRHPAPKVGALSAEASGASGEAGPGSTMDAEGPIPPPTV